MADETDCPFCERPVLTAILVALLLAGIVGQGAALWLLFG
jgi:hypothetical protein